MTRNGGLLERVDHATSHLRDRFLREGPGARQETPLGRHQVGKGIDWTVRRLIRESAAGIGPRFRRLYGLIDGVAGRELLARRHGEANGLLLRHLAKLAADAENGRDVGRAPLVDRLLGHGDRALGRATAIRVLDELAGRQPANLRLPPRDQIRKSVVLLRAPRRHEIGERVTTRGGATPEEIAIFGRFMDAATLDADRSDDVKSWRTVCQALLSSSEFIYVD